MLTNSYVRYYESRSDVNEPKYREIAKAKRISLSEAEALLYKGYVFGGHTCPLCMREQDKVDFEGYDFVGLAYVFEYSQPDGPPAMGIPFYTFYKEIGASPNGNTVYAQTYVPAIEVYGYEEYFESQAEEHQSALWTW